MKIATLPNQYAHMNVANNNGIYSNTDLSVDQRRNQVLINPSTAMPTTMASLVGSQLEFRIENNIDLIQNMYLRVKLNNTSGGNFIHAIPDFWLDRVEIWGQNGSVLLYSQMDSYVQFVADNIFRSRENHEATYVTRGYSDTTYTTTQITVADTATPTYNIHIAEQFFKPCRLRSYAQDGNLLIRFQFAPTGRIITSGTCSISSTQLRVVGFDESEDQRDLMHSRLLLPHDYHFYGWMKHTVTQSLAASTSYDITLSGIKGHVAALCWVLRKTSETSSATNQGAVYGVSTYEIKDSAGKALTGHNPIDLNDMQISYAMQYPNLLLKNKEIQIHTFCKAPVQCFETGAWLGGYEFNGFETLRITTPSGLASTTYEINVYALTSQILQSRKASLHVIQ